MGEKEERRGSGWEGERGIEKKRKKRREKEKKAERVGAEGKGRKR